MSDHFVQFRYNPSAEEQLQWAPESDAAEALGQTSLEFGNLPNQAGRIATKLVNTVARAIDDELGGAGQWQRLVVDATVNEHRENSKRLARAALIAIHDYDWPATIEGRVEENGFSILCRLPSRIIGQFISSTISAELAKGESSPTPPLGVL